MQENAIICSQLAIERCRQYITHIHAVLYLTETPQQILGDVALDNLHDIIGLLDQELRTSRDLLMIAQSAAKIEDNEPEPPRREKPALRIIHST